MTGPSPGAEESHLVGLSMLLGVTMIVSTYLLAVLSVLSPYMVTEFGISRTELGLGFTVLAVTGALFAPMMGSLSDRAVRPVLAGIFITGAGALVALSAAPNYGVVMASAVLGGLALSGGNPATNTIVALRVPPRRRGTIIGITKAGPPLSLLVAGAALPPVAHEFGWRAAVGVSVLLPLAGLLMTVRRPGLDGEVVTAPFGEHGGARAVRSAVTWLTLTSFTVALGLSSVVAFLPLYVEEQVGLSATRAGVVAAFMGLAGVISRVLWGNLAGRREPAHLLTVISIIAVLAILSVGLAARFGAALVWVGAFGIGTSMLAWHSVGWIMIIDRVRGAGIGRASGIMQLGGNAGLAFGPPLTGALVDSTGTYAVAWTVVGALFLATAALTLPLRPPAHDPSATLPVDR